MAKTIVVFSTKGGVGKTLVASNLAVSLAKDQNQRVCLLDFDLQAIGDMSRMLGLNPERSLVDMLEPLKQQGADFKKDQFFNRNAFGVDFLPAVLKPQHIPSLNPEGIRNAFSLLDKEYDYIIVDGGKSFNDAFMAALNQANLILLVITPDILSIYQTKLAFDTLQFLHFPLSMLRIVLNRAESLASISWQEIRANLPVDIVSLIPSEGRVVGQAVNRGIPVVVDNPRSKIGLAIKKLAFDVTKDSGLFIERRNLDELQLKEEPFEKSGDFWKKQGLSETIAESAYSEERDEIQLLKRRIHNRLIDELDLKRLDLKVFSDAKKNREINDKAEILVANLLADEAGSLISSQEERKKIVKEILNEALRLGPLEDLLADPDVTDIMVNNKDEVYVERRGRIERTDKKFVSNIQVKTVIERIIAPIGRRIDESVPMVDARLPDGSRVNAIIPPLSLTGPALTIRKFRKERFKIDELIGMNSLNSAMSIFLQACVASRKNIIVSGGTGSGKTTVLNVLSGFIPDRERIITIEDAAELRLHQTHWIRLESRPPNIEGKGAVTIRDLFRNTLRMRPDRIIIGECRGIETLDMLQAMNTGHDGSMTTIHANSTFDALTRLDSMILMSGVDLPVRSIREMIASAIDMIVHTARLADGTRKITQVSEISGMKEDGHIGLQDVFMFKQTGIDKQQMAIGNFYATGYVPSFIEEMKVRGIALPEDLFKTP
ncbi:MAG: ATPase, T2SS/T4P/T4SS family [Candidatus Omnitrophota bacterium]